MALIRKEIDNEKDWKAARLKQGIGASSSAAIVGMSPFQTSTELWQELTGQKERPDISGKEEVIRGHTLEPILRELFIATHPEYRMEYHPYDLLFQDSRPWAFCTLDGELEDTETGQKGIWECKTASLSNKAAWNKWDRRCPDNYYCQILWQFAASGYDFAILYAALFSLNGQITIREYFFNRKDCEEDMEWLMSEAEKFWQHVKAKTMPPMKLNL